MLRGVAQLNRMMRSSQVVRASDSQCRSHNCPEFDPSIPQHSGTWEAADEPVLSTVQYSKLIRKSQEKIPLSKIQKSLWHTHHNIFSQSTTQCRYLLFKKSYINPTHVVMIHYWNTRSNSPQWKIKDVYFLFVEPSDYCNFVSQSNKSNKRNGVYSAHSPPSPSIRDPHYETPFGTLQVPVDFW